jgi:hypothetical protein
VVWSCPSCGTVSDGRYCTACGEKRLDAVPLVPGLRLARTAPAVTWLRRLRASLQALASPPGKLTRDWLDGKRVGYLAPVTLFLYVNIAFFLIQSASGVSILSWPLTVHLNDNILGAARPLFAWIAGPNALHDARYVAVFDALERVNAKALVIVMVLAFAGVMRAVPGVRRDRSESTFPFAAHFYTYLLIAMSALFPLVALTLGVLAHMGALPPGEIIDDAVSTIQTVIVYAYLVVALQTLTPSPLWRRVLLATLLFGAAMVILRGYHLVVFAITLLTV